MSDPSIPRGAGFGRDANRMAPSLIDFRWTARHGSRAQRRAALKLIRQAARDGHPDAREVLAELVLVR
ncbi:MAG: hypothetical protein JNM61_09425 [Zoogloeaceae bacterium]|nr:hypothetical protein [Zoogloeaceae bacterium]